MTPSLIIFHHLLLLAPRAPQQKRLNGSTNGLQIRTRRPRKPLYALLTCPRRPKKSSGHSSIFPTPYPLPIPPPNIRRSARNRRAPVQDDDPKYERSSYQRKSGASKPRTTGEEVEDEGAPVVEREISEPVQASVGDETARNASLERDPVTYEEAIASPDADFWRKAMAEELEEFVRRELFSEVERIIASQALNGYSDANSTPTVRWSGTGLV
ncbi:hypothetical protein AN958_07822 [Leucoagaricus sp. SymC.cos]|nr:hypothetical protein AN958_07822 [Leucoagaricus sp. SymC.cos]